MKIISPITKTANIKKIRTIDTEWIINQYEKSFSLDVSYLFQNIKTIEVYQCLDTGYSFFYPCIEGDSPFYEHLAKNPWYYMPWKYEHEATLDMISDNMKVLEIGCGEGEFLHKIQSLFRIKATGLEMNANAILKARGKGLDIRDEYIQKHSSVEQNKYDLVCSFQVLEHIYDVDAVISSSIKCLLPGGKLIISVPNNDSFISEFDNILNMPPHHTGLWNEKSLRSLEDFYDIKVDRIIIEPLQEYHKNFFSSTVYRKVHGSYYENRFLRKFLNVLFLKPFVERYLEAVIKWIPGHTILAIYTKNSNI